MVAYKFEWCAGGSTLPSIRIGFAHDKSLEHAKPHHVISRTRNRSVDSKENRYNIQHTPGRALNNSSYTILSRSTPRVLGSDTSRPGLACQDPGIAPIR